MGRLGSRHHLSYNTFSIAQHRDQSTIQLNVLSRKALVIEQQFKSSGNRAKTSGQELGGDQELGLIWVKEHAFMLRPCLAERFDFGNHGFVGFGGQTKNLKPQTVWEPTCFLKFSLRAPKINKPEFWKLQYEQIFCNQEI